MQKPPSYNEATNEQKNNDAPPSYETIMGQEKSPGFNQNDSSEALCSEDMPPPIPAHYLKKQPVADTDQKITHNQNSQDLLLAQDQKQNGLIGANFMGADLRGAVRPDSPEPQPLIIEIPDTKQDTPILPFQRVEPSAPPLPIPDQDPHPTLIDSKKADMPPERIYSIGSLDNDAKELRYPLDRPTLRIIADNNYTDVERMFFKHFFSETSFHSHFFFDTSIFTVFIREFLSIKVVLEKIKQGKRENIFGQKNERAYSVDKLISLTGGRGGNKPILLIEKDAKRELVRSKVARLEEKNRRVYIIGEEKLHNVEHIKKAVQDIVDAELVRKGILPSKRSLDSLESATDLLLEAINLAISETSCAEKIKELRMHVEAIEKIKSNQRRLTCDQWSATVDSLKVFFDSAKAVICAHRNLAMSALSFLDFAPPTRSFTVSELKFNKAETLLSELRLREDHGHSESFGL